MNIKQAKEQIKNAMTAYFTKDERGNYMIPMHKQRPIFLMGPPGIGKTAIMEQVAAELGVGMLSYSMTHHTRQSALGLPYIEHKTYGDKEYAVSEYTMSEIIASIYDLMEDTGVQEGILFLDEINCVSETLAPIMLQFLQYKVFGRHRVPEGWVVVTAGNPPEYNNSVREFDIVTWDRLKRVDVEPNFDVWKEYAYKTGVHPAVLTYLDIRKNDFYKIESTIDGKRFVTARGWDDLSQMIALYEHHGLTVDEDLVGQYLQDTKIAKNFAVYYDLFNKYRSDYQVEEILSGNVTEEIKERAMKAGFDERLSLIGLLLDAVTDEVKSIINGKKELEQLMQILKQFRVQIGKSNVQPIAVLEALKAEALKTLDNGRKAGSLSAEKQSQSLSVIDMLEQYMDMIAAESDG
ncbi:MAG: AAA family ATPase, partial [Peptococcaceae bacterium]|nr:AAA family ATPase [Peptococcaceae bacterium]